jgi:hypothetical protein
VLTEALVAIGVAGVAILVTLETQNQNRLITQLMLRKQQCIAAAQAQLDCIEHSGESLPDEKISRLWPSVRLETIRQEGTGDWSDLDLVTVRATGKAGRRKVEVTLCRYMVPREGGSGI